TNWHFILCEELHGPFAGGAAAHPIRRSRGVEDDQWAWTVRNANGVLKQSPRLARSAYLGSRVRTRSQPHRGCVPSRRSTSCGRNQMTNNRHVRESSRNSAIQQTTSLRCERGRHDSREPPPLRRSRPRPRSDGFEDEDDEQEHEA